MDLNLTMLAQAIAFFIFFWFSKKYVWPPLMSAIAERQSKIAEGLNAAEAGKRALVEAEAKTESVMKDARDRSQSMFSDGERRANQIIEQAKLTAKTEADRILAAAQEQIQLELNKAKSGLREQVAQLAVAGAEKILKREINAAAHADMLTELKAQL
jgi:F-type H+-transporting ATPase subunit b